ncbi:MAG: ribbon-helix-helix protein, CopG family [Candidatus Diapherotrites archaeon]|nr:ribbon-helix-helix protein, CopG family [Candidatus Diapherotrites archaeon]
MNAMVNIRIGQKLLREIDSAVRNSTYESRTEFIREALRKMLDEHKKKRMIKSLRSRLGEGKRLGIKEPTPEEFERIREEVWEELHGKH